MSAVKTDGRKVLLVDDDEELLAMLGRFLQEEGLWVRKAKRVVEAEREMSKTRFDALVLDLMMPGEDGLSFAKRLRQAGDKTAIVMLTAKGDESAKIEGLDGGVDDYMAKPFSPKELLARLKTVWRRTQGLSEVAGLAPEEKWEKEIRFGAWALDTARRSLRKKTGEEEALSTGEFAVLKVFAKNPKIVLSRDRILALSQGKDREAFERSIDVRISRLRKLVEADPANPKVIQTVRSAGYVFMPADEEGLASGGALGSAL